MMMTKKAIALWVIALLGLIAGSVLLRLGDGTRVQVRALALAAAATEREATRVKAAEAGRVPLALHFTPRGLVSTLSGESVNIERAPANEVFAAMIDYERRGLGSVGQFAFALPEPGRVSGVLVPAPIPAAQK